MYFSYFCIKTPNTLSSIISWREFFGLRSPFFLIWCAPAPLFNLTDFKQLNQLSQHKIVYPHFLFNMLIWAPECGLYFLSTASHNSPRKMSTPTKRYCYGCQLRKSTKGYHFRKLENQSDSVKQQVEESLPTVEDGVSIPAKLSKVKWICGPCLQRFSDGAEKKSRKNPERSVKRRRASFNGTFEERV